MTETRINRRSSDVENEESGKSELIEENRNATSEDEVDLGKREARSPTRRTPFQQQRLCQRRRYDADVSRHVETN